MSQLHQAHCLRQCGRHCRDKGDQQQAADDGHIVHKHIRHDLGKRGAPHLDTHEQGVAHRRGDVALSLIHICRGYMMGYNDLKDPSVSGFFRFLAKVGDNGMKMQIVKIGFGGRQ